MARVPCSIEDMTLENENGYLREGVEVTCSRCENREATYGRSDRSVAYCMARLRESCPRHENNFYIAEDEYVAQHRQDGPRADRVGAEQSHTRCGTFQQPAPQASNVAPPSTAAHEATFIDLNRFAVLDIEATSWGKKKGEIVQIGIVQIDFGAPRWRTWTFVKPSGPIPASSTAVHRITDAHVADAPTFGEIAGEVARMIEGRILVGWRARAWMLPMLIEHCSTRSLDGPGADRADALDLLVTALAMAPLLDVMTVEAWAAKQLSLTGGHSTDAVALRWGTPKQTHNVMDDITAIWGLFVELAYRFPEIGQGSIDSFSRLPEPIDDDERRRVTDRPPASGRVRPQPASPAYAASAAAAQGVCRDCKQTWGACTCITF